jgi:hypothetical protein
MLSRLLPLANGDRLTDHDIGVQSTVQLRQVVPVSARAVMRRYPQREPVGVGVWGRPRIGVWGRDSPFSRGFYGHTLIT